MIGRRHLHHDDAPSSLTILADLLDHRASFPTGYEPTECGAWVDWDALGRSGLSSTEMAAVHIARGCAIAEGHGGLPVEVAGSVRAALVELTAGWETTADPVDIDDPVGIDDPAPDAYSSAEPASAYPCHPDQQGVDAGAGSGAQP